MPIAVQTPLPTPTAAPAEALITADQYIAMPDDGRRTELVKGRIVEMPPTGFRHGYVCGTVLVMIREFARAANLGRAICNDTGIVTRREPDSVRAPDVAYFSYATLPRDQTPTGYPEVSPELVFEVRSPSDRWPAITAKAAEYLAVGVKVVCVLDPEAAALTVFRDDESPRSLAADDVFTAGTVLSGFAVAVRTFLE